jgi:hypothetical protein
MSIRQLTLPNDSSVDKKNLILFERFNTSFFLFTINMFKMFNLNIMSPAAKERVRAISALTVGFLPLPLLV